MKFENYGYKERKIKVREMSIAELKVGIAHLCAKKNYNFVKIKLMNLTCGEVDVFDTPKDFILSEMNEGYEVALLQIKEVDVYNEELKVIEKTLVIITEEIEEQIPAEIIKHI